MPHIEIRDGSNKGMVHQIRESSLTIGRDETESIQIFDQGVSRRHAEIFRVGEMYFIQDLGSRNGTFVNEERIQEELLRVNDIIRVGNTELVFREGKPLPSGAGPKFTHGKKLSETSTTIEYRLEHADPADLEEPEDRLAAQENKTIQILVAANTAILAERDPASLLQTVVDIAVEALKPDHAYVFNRSADKQELIIGARYEKEGKKTPTVSTSVIRKVLKESRSVLISDAAQDPEYKGKKSIVSRGIHSVICAPLLSMQELQGVLFLHSAGASRQFTEQDLHLATAIAQYAGTAYQSLSFWKSQEKLLTMAVRTAMTRTQVDDPDAAVRHSELARVASAIASVMQLPVEENHRLQLSALLQGIGESGSEEEVLKDARRAEDLLRQRRRSELSPDGNAFPVSARILAVATAYQQSMGEGKAKSPKEALIKLKKGAKKRLDSKVVEALMVAFRNGTLDRPKDLLGGL